jgi:hypothetical protein
MLRLALGCSLAVGLLSAAQAAPLRLADGRPFVAVYYFGHWWDPWKSDDQPIRDDFAAFHKMGVSVLGVDHEWSQAIDGNWKWLDREHRLAKEAGLQIIPWLSLKVWSDLSDPGRMALAKQWYGTELKLGMRQDGTPGAIQISDPATLDFGAAYTCEYLSRYADQALLHVRWNGEARPVVALSVELGWDGGGFDDQTTAGFRQWLRRLYEDDLPRLNAAWGTQYKSFDDIQPRDGAIFDYPRAGEGKALRQQAVEDHVEYRAEVISDSLDRMAQKVRERYPEVLILAEVPYQFASRHPHAQSYRIGYACNPSCTNSADILWFRNTGPLDQPEADFLTAWRARTGKPVVLTYRTYSDWANERPAADTKLNCDLYAGQAAALADGFGFYSFNEMGDTHVAPSLPGDATPGALDPEQSRRSVALMAGMVGRYLELAAGR